MRPSIGIRLCRGGGGGLWDFDCLGVATGGKVNYVGQVSFRAMTWSSASSESLCGPLVPTPGAGYGSDSTLAPRLEQLRAGQDVVAGAALDGLIRAMACQLIKW